MSSICNLWKIYDCFPIPNCMRKIIWLPLMIYKWYILSPFSILRDKWKVRLLQLYWMKIWHVNSSVKINSLSPRHVWKLSSFFYLWNSVFFSHLNWRTWPESKRKPPCRFDAAFFTTVFQVIEKLCAVFGVIFAEQRLLNQHKLL